MKKTVNRALLIIVALAFTFSLSAQYAGATLEYVKLKPGQNNAYLELEKSVVPFHHARVEEGIITRWALYKKLYTSQNDPYDYILVSSNDDFKKTENSYPKELIDANYTKEEQSEFWKNASATRTIVKSEYYDRVTFAEGGTPYKYLRFIRYQVDKGGEFEKIRKELVKPLFDEVVKRELNAGWSIWKKDPNDRKFQYVAVNTYAEYGDWKNSLSMEEIFKEVFPDKDLNEARNSVMSTRTEINHEYWELVMSTDKPEE
jgi:hypothetical protein